jgi:trimethylamine--corrinoid protein Co-methyltransferase
MVESRRGGREARKALRAAPLAPDQMPVWPGMEGGLYRPLKDVDVMRIHRAALDVLAEIGMADAPPSGVEHMTKAGAKLESNGRLTFTHSLIEDMIAGAGRHFVLHGQDPRHDMEPWGKKVYFGTAGAAVCMVDPVTGDYRDTTARDLYDSARVVDALEHVHFFQRTMVCRDILLPFEMDFNTCYASVLGTSKHVGTSWGEPIQMKASLEMLHMIAGGEDKWHARPFVSQSNCFVVPPLRFAPDACLCLELAAQAGMPVFLVSAGQAGATSPAAIAGSLVQEIAECLAGLFYLNAVKKGAPAIFGPYCFISDLRTGAMSGGSAEQALLSAAAAQITQHYDLTCGTVSGMTDSKMPDVQAGYEKAYNHALVGNSGANLIYECGGMMASLLGFSMEQLVIDNDIVGAVQRTIRGIDVSDEALSVDAIRETCLNGPMHFLGNQQTLDLMNKEYVYPLIGDRKSPKEWNEQGRPSVVERASRKVKDILDKHYPSHISPELDAEIRRRFPVRLHM